MDIILAQNGAGSFGQIVTLVLGGLFLIICLVAAGMFAFYFRLFIQSILTGAKVTLWDLLVMSFRKVRPNVIVQSKIMAVQAGLGLAV